MTQEFGPNYQKLINKNLLCLDYGSQCVGVAQFTPGRDPFPLKWGRIIFKNQDQVLEEIKQICEDECSDLVIMGLPLYLDGKESDMTQRVRSFHKLLEERISPLPLILQDETLSTFEAKKRMENSPEFNFKVDPKQIDSLSAVIILESFLRSDSELPLGAG